MKDDVGSMASFNKLLDYVKTAKGKERALISHWISSFETLDAKKYSNECKKILSEEVFAEFRNVLTTKLVSFRSALGVLFPSQINHTFTFIDLFAGIGGFRIAMQDNGGKCLFSSEWNRDAQETYVHNFGEYPFGDITQEETKGLIPDNFDILCAGFPCQAFSIAGYQRGFEDTRGTLFFDVAKILDTYRPKAFFLENVKNLKAHNNGQTFKVIMQVLEKNLGYKVFTKVMSPDVYANLPQNRERIFIVGFNPKKVKASAINSFSFPKAIPLNMSVADCIDYTIMDECFYYSSKYGCYDEIAKNVIDKGTIYQWRRHYVRANKSNVCPTLTANMGTGGHNVPLIKVDAGIRKLTPRECLNFQGFPKAYEFPHIAISKCYMQAGNSVAVPLIRRVAEEIVRVIKKDE